MKPDIIFQSWNTESVLGSDVRHREVQTSLHCRRSPGVSRAPGNGLLALCFFAVMLSWTFTVLPPSSVQNQHCCAKHSAFSKFQPSCLWSIPLWSTSSQMPFPLTLVQILWLPWQRGLFPPWTLNGITLHTNINFCIAGASFPCVKETLSTINIIIHVTGSEHTFRGASAEPCELPSS